MRPFTKKSIVIGVILMSFIGIGFANVYTRSHASAVTPNVPLLTLTVNVTQVNDVCGVDSPCTAYVVITKGGLPIASPQVYTGPGNYTFTVAQNTNGTLVADVVNNYPSGGCTCVLNTTPASQTGPPYGIFYVTIP